MSNTAEVLRQCRSLPGVTVTEKESYTEMQLSSSQGHSCMRFVPPVSRYHAGTDLGQRPLMAGASSGERRPGGQRAADRQLLSPWPL